MRQGVVSLCATRSNYWRDPVVHSIERGNGRPMWTDKDDVQILKHKYPRKRSPCKLLQTVPQTSPERYVHVYNGVIVHHNVSRKV